MLYSFQMITLAHDFPSLKQLVFQYMFNWQTLPFLSSFNTPTTLSISPGMSYSSSSSASLAATVITFFCTTGPWACRLAARDRQPRWYLHKKQTQLIHFSDLSSTWNCQKAWFSSYYTSQCTALHLFSGCFNGKVAHSPSSWPSCLFSKVRRARHLNGSFSLSLPFLLQYNLLSITGNKERQNSHALKTSPKLKAKQKK